MSKANNRSDKILKCPTCGAPATRDSHPFCSKRCANIDLGRWFQGAYSIPAVDAADDSIVDADVSSKHKFVELEPNDK